MDNNLDKCEPVINLNILKYTEHGVIPDDFKGQASGYRAGWNDCLSSIQYMFSQPIEKCEPVGELILDPAFLPALKAPLVNWKINLVDLEVGTKLYTSPQPRECEPVAEALHERNRLGYAVVDVIGTLDEIIENTQEVEIDDFLHIAVPIDMWNELEAALEDMPKRADLYTSPISKECQQLADTLNFLKSHDCMDEEGYEYGICKVKFDNSGKPIEVLWSDMDAVIKLKTKKGIV